ncbi:MAG: antibiotic biosynthesis monooxygenase family protein [Pyrinomonadaceae bacterium]
MRRQSTSSSVTSVARISARPGKRRELFLTIASLLDPLRREAGCREYRFYGEASEEDSFVLIGEWEERSDFERHTDSENFSILLGSLELLSNEKGLDFDLLTPIEAVKTDGVM